jgi:ligand-binding sensor domain-containing protein
MKKSLTLLFVISMTILSCSKDNSKPNPEWTFFTYEDGFINERFHCLQSDENGKVYVGQEGGITVIENGTLTNIVNEELNAVDIYIVEQDRIWAADNTDVLRIFENGEWTVPNDDLESLHQIAKTSDNTYWFATLGYNLVIKYDGSVVERIFIPDSIITFGERIWCIEVDHNDVLWVGTSFGLCSFDGTDWKMHDIYPDDYSTRIDCIFEDNLGRLWVGGYYENVMRFDGTNWEAIEELPSTNLEVMCQSTNGDIWFGFKYGGGVIRYDGTNYIPFEEDFITNNYIYDMCQSSDGSMWFIGPAYDRYDDEKTVARLSNWE